MNATDLRPAERQALRVLAIAANLDGTHRDVRPCRKSNRTSGAHPSREMLTVQWTVADWLTERGLVRVTNDVLRTLELTAAGRRLAQEAGLA